MRTQISTIRIVASKHNDATDARSAALSDRDNQLRATSDMEWALAHTAARGAADYATFVDTFTFTPPAE